jgi:hypothetical protein
MNLAAEIAAAHAKNEAAVATSIAAPRLELDRTRLQHFADFCKQYGVRALPAAPRPWPHSSKLSTHAAFLPTP